jgi:hypothetical protein
MTTLIPKFDLKDGGATPTGAINRPINEKLAEFVSVEDFGATGDGTTNDSTAFNNALDALIAQGGGALYIPYGTYKVNLDWSARVIAGGYSKIIIYGNNSVLFGVTGATSVLAIDRGGSGDNYISSAMEFRNVRFTTDLNACSGGTPVINHAVYFSRSSADFYNCVFSGGSRSAFYGYNYQYGKFVDCQFNCSSVTPVTYPSAGCWIQSRYTETIADQMVFDRCVFDSSQNGLYIEGCQTLRVLNTRFQQHFSGGEGALVIKDFLNGTGSENILISACHFEVNQVRDIYLPSQTSRTTIQRCLFANPVGYIASFVATAEQTSTNMTYQDNDFRTASGPTLVLSGDNSVLNYLGNDKSPYSFTATGANPQTIIQNTTANNIDFQFSTLAISAFWGKVGLVMGSNYLWVDSSGRLRIKNGAPSSDTDGTVVGTQT